MRAALRRVPPQERAITSLAEHMWMPQVARLSQIEATAT